MTTTATPGIINADALKIIKRLTKLNQTSAYVRVDNGGTSLALFERYTDSRGIDRTIDHTFPLNQSQASRIKKAWIGIDTSNLRTLAKTMRSGDALSVDIHPDGGRNGYLEKAGLTACSVRIRVLRHLSSGKAESWGLSLYTNPVPVDCRIDIVMAD